MGKALNAHQPGRVLDMRALVIFLSLISFSAQAATCGLESHSFESMAESFTKEWTGDPTSCQAEKFKELNRRIGAEMRTDPAQYDQRMKYLASLPAGEAREYLFLSFQETWFYIFINQVLQKEWWRTVSMAWDPRTLVTMAGTIGLLATPYAKAFRTKAIRYFQKGLKFFFAKPAIVGTAIIGVNPGSIVVRDKSQKVIEFVKPPLFYLKQEEEHYDPRTDNIYTDNLRNDFYEISGGVVGSTMAGTGAVWLAAKKPRLKSWPRLLRAPGLKGKVFKLANPKALVGIGATFITTKILGKVLGDKHFDYDFNRLQETIRESLERLRAAAERESDLGMWLESQKLRNTLVLDRNWLVGGIGPDLWDMSAVRARMILADAGLCLSAKEQLLEQHKDEFFNEVRKEISESMREIESSHKLFLEVEQFLKQYPQANLPELREFINVGLKDHEFDKNAELSAEVLWKEVAESVLAQDPMCIPMQGYYP